MPISDASISGGGDAGGPEGRWSIRSALASLLRFLREEPLQAIPLVFLTFLAAGLMSAVIDQPIRCDEAGTYLDFVRYNVTHITSDYTSTNNHILYSLAAKLSQKLFGVDTLTLRLPALLAGILLVPCSYLGLRAHFTNTAALVGAGLVATSPYLVDQATNARGYTILNVCFMLLLALVPHLLVARRRGPWWLFAALGALGTYAVPIMLFPLGILGTWLVLGMLFELPRAAWWRFAVRLALGCLTLGALVALLYAPTFFSEQAEQVIVTGARFDATLKQMTRLDRVISLGEWMARFWGHALYGVPSWVALGSLALAALGMAGGRRRWLGLRVFLATAVGFVGVVFVTGRQPPLWSMSFLIPLYLGLAGAGAAVLGRIIGHGHHATVPGLLLVVLGGGQGATALHYDGQQGELPWYMGYYDAEEASLRIDHDLPPLSPIVAIGRELGPIYYYQDARGDKTPGNADRVGFLEAREAYLIDSGVAKSRRLKRGLKRWGFEPTDEVIDLADSRIVRYELVREPSQEMLDSLPDPEEELDAELEDELDEHVD